MPPTATSPSRKRSIIGAAAAALMMVTLVTTASADDQGRERRDGRRFRELQSDLQEAATKEAKLLEAAVEQARGNKGKSEPSTLAELTNVMEQKDRIHHHLRELALRNGWDVPDIDGETGTETAPTGALGRMVGRASAAVQAELAEEARQIAARLELPLLPLPPATPAAADTAEDAAREDEGDGE